MSTEASPAVAAPVENGAAPDVPVEQPGHKVSVCCLLVRCSRLFARGLRCPRHQLAGSACFHHQRGANEGLQVFAGNLAYSTTDDGLKAFFAPVAADM